MPPLRPIGHMSRRHSTLSTFRKTEQQDGMPRTSRGRLRLLYSGSVFNSMTTVELPALCLE